MKKLALILLAIICVTLPISAAVGASFNYTYENVELTYVIIEEPSAKNNNIGKVSVSKGKNITTVKIPDTIIYNSLSYQVNEINAEAFSQYSNLKYLTIGNNVNNIGESAFYRCICYWLILNIMSLIR